MSGENPAEVGSSSSSAAVAATPAFVYTAQDCSVPYRRLYCPDKWDILAIVLGTLGALANAPILPGFVVFFGDLINNLSRADVSGDEIEREVNRIAISFAVLGAWTMVASSLEVSLWMWSARRQVARHRQRFLEAALNQEQAFYDTEATSGDVVSGLNSDCNAVQAAIGEKVANVIRNVGIFIASIITAFIFGWELTLVILALTPLIVMAGALASKAVSSGTEKLVQGYTEANVIATQSIANMRTVASFQAEAQRLAKYEEVLAEPKRVQTRVSTISGTVTGLLNGVFFIMYAVAFRYALVLVRDRPEAYEPGDVMTILFAVIVGGMSLGQTAPNFPAFASGRVAGARLLKVIERESKIDMLADGLVPDAPLKGDIEVKGLAFSYPARADVAVFRALCLSVSAGQTVALVGASGSGKSTVIQLLERFYDPAAGSIHVDGHDIRSLSLGWYRNQVGLVSQEPTLFATSIHENIALGRAGASNKEVEAAAAAANAHGFIAKLPQGYQTQVGEKGVQLSGGQKQRVAIARALLKNPAILLLDEATSALDNVSERLVQDALERLAADRTTLVVAHRLPTIRSADKIAVLQGGTVIEEGTHDELFSNEASSYHALVQLQQQAMDERAATRGDEVVDVAAADEVAVVQPSFKQGSSKKVLETGASLSAPGAAAEEGDKDALTAEEKEVKVGFGRLLSMVRPEWALLATGLLASTVLGLVQPAFAFFISRMITSLQPSEPLDRGLTVVYIFAVLAAITLAGAAVQGVTFARTGANLAQRVRVLFMRATLHMEVAWFDEDANSSGALAGRLAGDAPLVRGAVSDLMGFVVQNIATVIGGFLVAFIAGWKMTLVVVGILPLVVVAAYVELQYNTGGFEAKGDTFGDANAAAHEATLALRTVASFNLQRHVTSTYARIMAPLRRKELRKALLTGVVFGTLQGVFYFFTATAFWFGGREVARGNMSLDEMLRVFFGILLASIGLSQTEIAFPSVAQAGPAVRRLFRVIDRKSLIDAADDAGVSRDARGAVAVALQDVTFAYPTRPDVTVFKHFSLTAAAAQMTALVGESGSGKSTIINLVERFYDVSEGQVLVDGVDVRELSVRWLRSQVGLVSQEPVLFNGTILDNLRVGLPAATVADAERACAVSNALEFIQRQPLGFGTLLGEGGGITLSGGQKQRLAIARAVLKDPSILLLDEATSALDAESERLVQDALDKLMVGRTSIVVAHRLTTIRRADKIAVVQAGVVLEQGSHDELMAKGAAGAYVKLARAQAGA